MVKDRRQLILDHWHLGLLVGDFGEDVFGDAPPFFFLEPLDGSLVECRILDASNQVVCSKRLVQSSRVFISPNSVMDSRYVRTQVCTASRALEYAQCVIATSHNEAGRETLISHSQGAGSVLVQVIYRENNSALRSRESAEVAQCASPQHCTLIPETVSKRDPRPLLTPRRGKNVNAEIVPFFHGEGSRWGTRSFSAARTSPTASGRSFGAFHRA
jgi:hypothetical protein